MPDLPLRFHKDMLVLSSSSDAAFRRLGVSADADAELTLLLEADLLDDYYALEQMAGAQCLVTPTARFTPLQLAMRGMEANGPALAREALALVNGVRRVGSPAPQHVLVEIGPCGLPLDPSSKASLLENRDQYIRAARLFERAADGTAEVTSAGNVWANDRIEKSRSVSGLLAEGEDAIAISPAALAFDGYLLNGFVSCDDLRCALMGLALVTTRPIFASVDVNVDGSLRSGRGSLGAACELMEEYGASVCGFSCDADVDEMRGLAEQAASATSLPLLVQCEVHRQQAAEDGEYGGVLQHEAIRDAMKGSDGGFSYGTAASMEPFASAMHDVGVQFLRAVGDATPAYTGVLAATVAGLDVAMPKDVMRQSGGAFGDIGATCEGDEQDHDSRRSSKARDGETYDDHEKVIDDSVVEKLAARMRERVNNAISTTHGRES